MRGRGCRNTARSSNKRGPSCSLPSLSGSRYFLAIFISCWSVIKGSSLKLEGILSRVIIFAKFDRASSSQTCPGVCGVWSVRECNQCLQFAKCGSTIIVNMVYRVGEWLPAHRASQIIVIRVVVLHVSK